MKKIKLLFFLLTGMLILDSCQKTIDTVVPTNTTSKISFKVSGVSKQCSGDQNVTAAFYSSVNSVQIIGRLTSTEGVSLMINNFKGVGQYEVEDLLLSYSVTVDNPLDNTYMSLNEGTVKVTSFSNNHMKGEFNFKGENSPGAVKMVTEGTFDTKFLSM